jgi:hypothetical protein
MKAAVVSSFDSAPRYQEFPIPEPAGEDELLVDVLAAGLHPRVRSQADGSHYTSTGELPGPPATDAMVAIITNRSDRGKPLSWIEIGSVAGRTAEIPSAALRAARLQLVGSGQGSVSTREYLAELDILAQEIAAGAIAVDARAVPLAQVEEAWAATGAKHRIVLVPRRETPKTACDAKASVGVT